MRSLPGCGNLLLISLTAAYLSCSSALPRYVASDPAVIEGEIAVKENNPFDRSIFLIAIDERVWKLDCGKSEGELSRLAGHTVRITGTHSPGAAGENNILVERYSMMPVDGMLPSRGVIDASDGMVILRTGEYQPDLSVSGPLKGALSAFNGLAAWIWGELQEAPSPEDPHRRDTGPAISLIDVKGYVILGSSRGCPGD